MNSRAKLAACVAIVATLAFMWFTWDHFTEFPNENKQLHDAYTELIDASERLAVAEGNLENERGEINTDSLAQVKDLERQVAIAAQKKAYIKRSSVMFPMVALLYAMIMVGAIWSFAREIRAPSGR